MTVKGGTHTEEARNKIRAKRALQVITEETKKKISLATTGEKNPNFGKPISDAQKKKISESLKGNKCALGHILSEDAKKKISKARKGKRAGDKHPFFGKKLSDETKKKLSEANMGTKNPRFGTHHTDETKKKMSKSHEGYLGLCGENNPAWKGGISFEPYCHKFNDDLKEQIRNQFGRCCVLCGKHETIQGSKLSVHHIDYNKKQGCEGHQWKLVPLCRNCHAKTNNNREVWESKICDIISSYGAGGISI